jgi:hypothetical protein
VIQEGFAGQMAKKPAKSKTKKTNVRIARPRKRPFQLLYKCPTTGKEVRESTGTQNGDEAEQHPTRRPQHPPIVG